MGEPEKQSVTMTESSGGIMIECGTNQPIEKVLAAEDAVSSPPFVLEMYKFICQTGFCLCEQFVEPTLLYRLTP